MAKCYNCENYWEESSPDGFPVVGCLKGCFDPACPSEPGMSDFLEGPNDCEEFESKKPLTEDELGDELCNYCPLEEHQKGVHCYGGVVHMCEGSACSEAYEAYLEEFYEEKDG